ncbi:hypothetical protein BC628DRAFT_1318293 [Trametes gibbosa]|nr:hypothetical protein BC628DRAFT_1318293 [Trametes gibbosa]
MSAHKDMAPTTYAASCNPPRRAKRQQPSSSGGAQGLPQLPASPDKQQQRRPPRPPILPKQQVVNRDYHIPPSPESDSPSEDEYDPGRDAAPAPKRRGRKPGAMSRTARESLRKLNHSKIEKARRTKINETLSALSTLVNDRGHILPASPGQSEDSVEDDAKAKKGKGKAEEKEFKLDVLVKTVEYMQDLIARVKALEQTMCAQCRAADQSPSQEAAPATAPATKRKHVEDVEDVRCTRAGPKSKRPHRHLEEEDSYVGDDEHGIGNGADEELPSPMPFAQTAAPKSPGPFHTSSPRLPPIASWLPHPYVDPSSFMSTPSSSALVRSPQNAQLPSPPASGRFRQTATLASMPSLMLPGPAHPLTLPAAAMQGAVPPRHGRKSVSASPSVSPTWTPEDETAASLLLQMSSKPPSSSSSSRSPPVLPGSLGVLSPREVMGLGKERFVPRAVEAVTPGALLGMRD